jgi:hypothetical protein
MKKKFELKQEKFQHLFRACAILTNFIHTRRQDMNAQIDRNRHGDIGWMGDF